VFSTSVLEGVRVRGHQFSCCAKEIAVVGRNGPKIENKVFWKWLQLLDSGEYSGAPKATILELFSTISWQPCHRSSFRLG
jgi:hypothetical protein